MKNRKSIRLSSYDYSQDGWYFVTICSHERECIFGEIQNEKMVLNDVGKIVKNIWQSLPNHHPVELDTFQIMPNHIHFIIHIVDAGRSRPTPTTTTTTLGTIVGLFKSECTKQINAIVGATRGSPVSLTRGSFKIHVWQRNYFECIIRNEKELEKIRKYVKLNPTLWHRDRNNPNNL